MQEFARLLDRLILSPGRNAKIKLMVDHFASTPDPDRGWALAAIAGSLELNSIKGGAIRSLISDRMDEQLFAMSYDFVGDMAETVSLVWPERRGANTVPTLTEVVETLQQSTRPEAIRQVELWLDALNAEGRWALLKLITGGLRIGVSSRLAKVALAEFGSVDVTEIEELWHGIEPPYADLFAWLEGNAPKPEPDLSARFRPVMLAHPLVTKAQRDDPDAVDPDLITGDQFAAEWKWDGIRVQVSSENDVRRIYTRSGDDISHTFPDLISHLGFSATLDGELLVRTRDGRVAPFNDLQQRLNRKTVSKKQMDDHPAFVRVYDLLWIDGEDLRSLPFRDRRTRLEAFVSNLSTDRIDLSELVPVTTLNALDILRNNPPEPEIEGLMLKRWDSVYEAGRPKGPWYKWKRDPFTVDTVMMYAQRGHGKRSSFYSDYTFGVWRDVDGQDELTPVGKAYFGFTDDELKQLDKFVRDHTVDRFGPVRAVEATKETGLVVELAFEGLQRSPRHKSGIAMRFPRVNRIRWDKPTAEADRIESLEAMLDSV